MPTGGTEIYIQSCLPIPSLQMMGQKINIKFTIGKSFDDASKHRCGHYETVNKIEIYLKIRQHDFSTSSLVIECIIKGSPESNLAHSVSEFMFSEMTVYAAANVVD